MNEHEHRAKNEQATKPAQDEVAKKAYATYLKEGRPQGHAEQNWLEAEAQLQHAGATYRKMIQNLLWATGYNVVAIPLAAGALYAWGVLLSPAMGAVLMSASTVIVAINARLLRLKGEPKPEAKAKPKLEAKADPTPDAKAESTPESKVKIPSDDLAPQIAKRAYELYEERSHENVRADQDWEQAEREIRKDEAKTEPQPEAKKEQAVEEREQGFSINTKKREKRDQKIVTTTTKKGA